MNYSLHLYKVRNMTSVSKVFFQIHQISNQKNLSNLEAFSQPRSLYANKLLSRSCHTQKTVKIDVLEEEMEPPLKFSTSGAAKWHSKELVYRPIDHTKPKWERYPIAGSLAMFLIYFCILREENDIDDQLHRPLDHSVPAFQKLKLEGDIRSAKLKGEDIIDLEDKLRKLCSAYESNNQK